MDFWCISMMAHECQSSIDLELLTLIRSKEKFQFSLVYLMHNHRQEMQGWWYASNLCEVKCHNSIEEIECPIWFFWYGCHVSLLLLQPPRPHRGWQVLDAVDWAPVCPQPIRFVGATKNAPSMDEDCLYLNIYTPTVKVFKILLWMIKIKYVSW